MRVSVLCEANIGEFYCSMKIENTFFRKFFYSKRGIYLARIQKHLPTFKAVKISWLTVSFHHLRVKQMFLDVKSGQGTIYEGNSQNQPCQQNLIRSFQTFFSCIKILHMKTTIWSCKTIYKWD
jgi:hypothetical protein